MKTVSDTQLFIVLSTLLMAATLSLIQGFDFRLVNAIIVEHVLLGSVAFIIGTLALLTKKGSSLHKKTGQLFYVFMTISCLLTLVIAAMPYHVSFSMFQISVMSLYFLIGGKRSLLFRSTNHQLNWDKYMAYVVIVVSVFVMFYSVIQDGVFYPLRTVFGAVAISFAIIDLWLFRQLLTPKKYWLAFHLSKMMAGYTTAVTGFFVAQDILGGYYNWFTPTVLCFMGIGYWLFKTKLLSFRSIKRPKISKGSSFHY